MRKLDKSETRRQKSGSVDSTPILAAKFKHGNRSGRKGRWSLAAPVANQQVSLIPVWGALSTNHTMLQR